MLSRRGFHVFFFLFLYMHTLSSLQGKITPLPTTLLEVAPGSSDLIRASNIALSSSPNALRIHLVKCAYGQIHSEGPNLRIKINENAKTALTF